MSLQSTASAALGGQVGLAVGAVLIALGSYGMYRAKRRRFMRRNALGVEVFENYRHMLGARFADSLLMLMGMAVFGIGGAIAMFAVVKF